MSGAKETPRQKMIGMMYLVLTAMLALNVSTSILKSFIIVNRSMVQTNQNFLKKVESMHALFDKGYLANKEKMQENYDKSKQAQKYSAEFRKEVRRYRDEMVATAEGITIAEADKLEASGISRQDNYDTPSWYFINQGNGKKLMEAIQTYKTNMLSLIPEESRKVFDGVLDTKGPFTDNDGKKIDWVHQNFYQVIIVGAITILNRVENDAMNLEYDVVAKLYSSVSDDDFKFDNISARIVPKSSYVLVGDVFEAEIFVAAYDSKSKITATVGGQTLVGENGLIKFKRQATREGIEKLKGEINVPTIIGEKSYPFETEYVVAKPSATVSADAMNVFYIGVDNPVSLSAGGMDPRQCTATINNGTITKSGDKYIVRVSSGREATITVMAKVGDANRNMGSQTFRVKRVPDPVAVANGIDEGTVFVDRGVLANSGGLRAYLKDFDFDLRVSVVSFSMQISKGGGDIIELKSNSNRFTDEMESAIRGSKKGTKVFFDDIVVRMPTGNINLRNFFYSVK